MRIEERIPLATLTTLHTGGEARAVAYVCSEEELLEALEYAHNNQLSYYVLGEGSNVLPNDEGYDGLIIRMCIQGIEYKEQEDVVLVEAGAGVSWDALVTEVTHKGLWGFENLAGIPGTVGATPVQNIGAYGADISQTLVSVRAYDAQERAWKAFSREACALGYRDSRFKHEPHLIITRVTFALSTVPAPRITYGDLLVAQERGDDLSTPSRIADTVRLIRSKKFPDRTIYGTAGSFFKNPVLSKETYAALAVAYGVVPQFPHPDGIKIPLAFILDRVLSLRGFRIGNASLYGAQPLVLVLDPGGKAEEVDMLAREVEARVKEKTDISIEREVRTMPKK